MTPRDARSAIATIELAGLGAVPVAAVALAGQPGLCAAAAPRESASTQYFFLFLGTLTTGDGGSATLVPPSAAGAFTVFAGAGAPPTRNAAVVAALTTDSSCHSDPSLAAAGVSGTVQLTAIDGQAYAGSFDLQVAAGVDASGNAIGPTERVTGAFSTKVCPGLAAIFSGPPSCM
jgi:hypothetical protein